MQSAVPLLRGGLELCLSLSWGSPHCQAQVKVQPLRFNERLGSVGASERYIQRDKMRESWQLVQGFGGD